jgi:hypothetical protein
MTVRFQCGDGAALVEYVYGELGAQDAAGIEAHLAACGVCADEVRGLTATREDLRAWIPPEAALGFQVVAVTSNVAPVLRAARWWARPLPAWAQVAAAVTLFAAGATLGAWRASGASAAAANAQGATESVVATAPVSAEDLTALEQRLRAELTAASHVATAADAQAMPVATATGAAPARKDDALLQQVRALIRESEQRQQRELTLRTAEIIKDVDTQRRGDLARIERTFGQMEGTTGVQVEQQRQLLNYLMRVSQRPAQ